MSNTNSPSPPESTDPGNRSARPRRRKLTNVGPDLTPAHNFAALRRQDAIKRRTKKGADIMEAVLGGASLAEVSQRTGHCHRTLRKMLANFSAYAPEQHQEMTEGLRELLGKCALHDLIHWRNLVRQLRRPTKKGGSGSVASKPDVKHLRFYMGAYRCATHTLIKLYNLGAPSMLAHSEMPSPLTSEDFRERLRNNPNMVAELQELLRGLSTVVPPAVGAVPK